VQQYLSSLLDSIDSGVVESTLDTLATFFEENNRKILYKRSFFECLLIYVLQLWCFKLI
jgi:hypothetical protein